MTPYELLYYEENDYRIAVWFFPDESKVRVYLNNYSYDSIEVKV